MESCSIFAKYFCGFLFYLQIQENQEDNLNVLPQGFVSLLYLMKSWGKRCLNCLLGFPVFVNKNFIISTSQCLAVFLIRLLAGNTALHYACILGSVDIARTLLRRGADVNLQNKQVSGWKLKVCAHTCVDVGIMCVCVYVCIFVRICSTDHH